MIFKNVTFYNEVFQKDVADIQVENGRITAIGVLGQEGRDMQGYTLLPGFVDIHIHGRGGGDFSDGTVSSMDRISASLAKCGVTAFCGTTMTLPREKLTDILVTARGYMGKEAGARLLGVNLEGPFIAPAKKGAQNGDYIRPGTVEEWNALFDASGRSVKLITLAPEAFDSADLIRQISGCCRVSLGHSCATAEEANAAFDAGAGHVTHLFNAMPPMSHRAPGLPGAALDRSEVTCELICDGGHIDPIMLRNAFRLLGQDRACVISDSMRAAGLGPGTYELGGQTVYVKENGRYAVLEDARGRELARVAVPAMSAPTDLLPKTAKVSLPLGGRKADGLYVRVALEGEAELVAASGSSQQYAFRIHHDGRLLASGRAAAMLSPAAHGPAPTAPAALL